MKVVILPILRFMIICLKVIENVYKCFDDYPANPGAAAFYFRNYYTSNCLSSDLDAEGCKVKLI